MTEKRMFAPERRLTFAADMRFVIRERFRRTVPERETLAVITCGVYLLPGAIWEPLLLLLLFY